MKNNVLTEDVTDCLDDCEVFDLDGPDSAEPGEYKEMVSHTITDNDQGIALAPNYESLDIDELNFPGIDPYLVRSLDQILPPVDTAQSHGYQALYLSSAMVEPYSFHHIRPPDASTGTLESRKKRKSRPAKKAQVKLPSLMNINLPDNAAELVWVSRAPSNKPSWTPTGAPPPGKCRPVGIPLPRPMASSSDLGFTPTVGGDLQDAGHCPAHHHPGQREPVAHQLGCWNYLRQDHLLRQ